MKHLQKFEELDPSTYRTLRDRTADYPFSQFKAQTPEMKSRADKMGRINKLSKERFEEEFYSRFPVGTKIMVKDSENPNSKVELEFEELMWRANWTYYTLVFKQANSPFYRGNADVFVRFQGDTSMSGSGDPYTMDPGHKFGFKGQIILDDSSKQLVKSMFRLGMEEKPQEVDPEVEEVPMEEKPKGFISKVSDFFKR